MAHTAATQLCFHCQSPVSVNSRTGTRVSITIDGEEQPLCCPACLAAVQFIREMNLESYYQYRAQCGVDSTADMNAPLPDAADLEAAVTVRADGRRQLSLLIPDLRCVACVWLLEEVLKQLGANDIRINYATRRLKVELDENLTAASVAARIRSLGYTVKADLPDAARDAFSAMRRSMLTRLGVAGIGMMQVMMFALAAYLAGGEMEPAYQSLMRWASMALTTPVVFYSAWPFHRAAWYALRNRSLVMDVPVSIAILAAWALSVYNTLTQGHEVYFDTACMFTFFLLIGRYIELLSRYHFQQSQDLLEHLLPRLVYRVASALENVSTDQRIALSSVSAGDILRVRPGETVPADGVVIRGTSGISEAAFTGEPLPQHKEPGSRVLAGALNHDGELLIRVRCAPEKFVIRQIATLYEQASLYRPRWSQLADRTASWFIAAVLLIATGAALFWYQAGSPDYFVIALTVLVVACPCALSLATPVAYSVATTTLRRNGVVIKNGAFLERAAETSAIVFDKTGTLTEAALKVTRTQPTDSSTQEHCLALASALEMCSEHPIAHAFQHEHQYDVSDASVMPGNGVQGVIAGELYRIGRADFASGRTTATDAPQPPGQGLWILLTRDFQSVAWFELQDSQREEAASVIDAMNKQNLLTAVFTGDSSMSSAQITQDFGVQRVITGMSPEDKVHALKSLQSEYNVMMLGDGINDTAALAAADTSLAVSPRDVFVQNSADATLLGSSLGILPAILRFARKSRRIIRQNIVWSITYNFTVIPFALMGMVPPWLAALGMSLSSVLVVSNAGRLRRMEP
jgi:P-type Cu2+ transporter